MAKENKSEIGYTTLMTLIHALPGNFTYPPLDNEHGQHKDNFYRLLKS